MFFPLNFFFRESSPFRHIFIGGYHMTCREEEENAIFATFEKNFKKKSQAKKNSFLSQQFCEKKITARVSSSIGVAF